MRNSEIKRKAEKESCEKKRETWRERNTGIDREGERKIYRVIWTQRQRQKIQRRRDKGEEREYMTTCTT